MKKTDLKVGETYACTIRPQRSNTAAWRRDRAFKATLVAISGTVTLREQKTVRKHDGEVFTDFTKEHGIVVELDEPIERERDEYVYSHGYMSPSPEAVAVMNAHADAKVTDTWTQRALKNAGCILMTWAEHEAEIEAAAKLEKARAAQTRAAMEKEEAEADDAEEQVILARAKLTEAFGDEYVEVERTDWRGGTYRYGDYTAHVRLEERLGNWTKRPVDAKIEVGLDAFLGLTIGERFVPTEA